MAILNEDLTKVQIGIEATPGTLVPATNLIPFMEGSYRPVHERKLLDEKRGLMSDYEDVLVYQASELELTQELDYENILASFLCGFASAPAAMLPAGAGPYVWTFTPGRTAPVDLASATFEIAESDGGAANYRRRFGYARPTSIGIEVDEETGQLTTTWMGRAAQTLATPAAVNPLARRIVPAALFSCYVDDTWATLGTTLVGQVRSMTLDYVPGLAPAKNKQGRVDLDHTGFYRSRFQGSVTLSIDHDGDTSPELTHFEAGDLRFIRLAATTGSGTSLRRLQLDHSVRYIDTPDVLSADGKQHTLELVGQLRSDTTADANLFEAEVTNGLATY